MTHPYDTAESSSLDRRVMLAPVDGSGPSTLTAGRDDPAFHEGPSELRAFNQPILWTEGRISHRLLPEDTEAFIPIVEKRLELNRELLARLPAQIADQEAVITEFQTQLDAAYARVQQLVVDDVRFSEARSPWKPSGWIISTTPVITPEAHLRTRGCLLNQTPEWRAYETLLARRSGAMSPLTRAKSEKHRLEGRLAEERILTGLLESRLHHLRENLEYWARQEG